MNMMSEDFKVRAGNPVYPILEGTNKNPSFLITLPSGRYLDPTRVREVCDTAGAVPSSGLELGLARLAKDLPQEAKNVLDQMYFRFRTPILYGLKRVGGKLAGFSLVGSNLPADSDVLSELIGRYLGQPNSQIKKNARRLVLKAKDKLAKRIAEYAQDNN